MSYELATLRGSMPSCCELTTDPTLGFSLNPFKLIGKVLKPALVVGSFFVPGGPLIRTAAQLAVGKLTSGGGGAKTTGGFGGFANIRSLVAAAQARAAAQSVTGPVPSPVSAGVPAAPMTSSMVAQPADMSYAAAGGGTPTDTAATTPASAAVPGAGIGIAVVMGLALLAMSRRKR